MRSGRHITACVHVPLYRVAQPERHQFLCRVLNAVQTLILCSNKSYPFRISLSVKNVKGICKISLNAYGKELLSQHVQCYTESPTQQRKHKSLARSLELAEYGL